MTDEIKTGTPAHFDYEGRTELRNHENVFKPEVVASSQDPVPGDPTTAAPLDPGVVGCQGVHEEPCGHDDCYVAAREKALAGLKAAGAAYAASLDSDDESAIDDHSYYADDALDDLFELAGDPAWGTTDKLKLGKLEAKHDPRTLRLKTVFAMRPDPVDFDWTRVLPGDLGMMRNDEMGNCTCAGVGHMIQMWTAANGGEVTISDDDVVAAYKAITLAVNGRAYDPADPSTDTGLALLDVLKYWRNTGIGGHKIGGFAKLDHDDLDEIRAAGNAFGGLYTGAQMPLSAQATIGGTWTAGSGQGEDARGSWAGHCLVLAAASASGAGGVKYITWGKRQDADMSWVTANADEMYAVFSADWVSGVKPAPSGLNVDQLRAYLANL